MTTRGINFLYEWMAEHLPNAMTSDPFAIRDFADNVTKEAEQSGITTYEIEEEVGNVFEVIFEAMLHRDGGLPE
ncbi:hypothetical protein OHD62_19500 [Mesorhizobium sp. YC-39]|uniref:DUF768 domain-containing protein n=1 Tax=unclassified Mesorhizobium TaxID=325217 RepID=UPI0021E79E7D|nr:MULTISPECIES: hypothetical protein [unclassified Mesorhizobium]MCV3210030.1 hypothetical protein [Mesorhizobium sp. YC-2]MCV3230560.1 hypothetical protein [Mesorhizobium sp. YC-39]